MSSALVRDSPRFHRSRQDPHGFYGAPLEVTIASVLLYQLLGLSAFAGFVVLPLVMPLTAYFSRLSARLVKEWLKAKDAQTGVLTELISAVKFIKVSIQ